MITKAQMLRVVREGHEKFSTEALAMFTDWLADQRANEAARLALRDKMIRYNDGVIATARQQQLDNQRRDELLAPLGHGLERELPRIGGDALEAWRTKQSALLMQS